MGKKKEEPKKQVKHYVSLADQKEIKKKVDTDKEWGSFNPSIAKINR
jgi:hypothetical protein